jgi:predicted N-acetyltransferase YhbS
MKPTLDEIVEVFSSGFSYSRSIVYPYEVERRGVLTVLRDAPRPINQTRNQEIVTTSLDADVVVDQVRSFGPSRFFLCVLHDLDAPADEIKANFKSHDFRVLRTEPVFSRSTHGSPEPQGEFRLSRLVSEFEANAVERAIGKRQPSVAMLANDDGRCRQYAAWDGERPVGWVSSIRTPANRSWVSNLHVVPDFRRRGIGGDLMRFMLKDDSKRGIQTSVLFASTDGAKLYGTVGYEQVGLLQMFAPIKSLWASYCR